MTKPSLGVFGFGQFMRFFTPYLIDFFDVYIHDVSQKNTEDILKLGAHPVSKKAAAGSHYVLLGYPAGYISDLILDISPFLRKDAVVFDICSIKSPPVQHMLNLLPPTTSIIATHPVFGPQSGKNGISGLKMTFSNVRCDEEIYRNFIKIFSEGLGLEVIEISPEEHDKQMAYIQGITHFIGRALKQMHIPNSLLATQSYLHLRETKEMVGNDTDALFLSIQNDNPYTKEVREKLLSEFERLHDRISKSNT